MYKLWFFLLVAFTLLSCGSRDVDYYSTHPEEIKKKLEECSKKSIAEGIADRECAAASKADSKRFFGDKVKKPFEGSGNGRPTKQF